MSVSAAESGLEGCPTKAPLDVEAQMSAGLDVALGRAVSPGSLAGESAGGHAPGSEQGNDAPQGPARELSPRVRTQAAAKGRSVGGADAEPSYPVAPSTASDHERESGSQDHSAGRKLAIADWSPLDGPRAGQEAAAEPDTRIAAPASPAGSIERSNALRPPLPSEGSEETETDSENDAAATYVSKGRQQAQESVDRLPPKKRKTSLQRREDGASKKLKPLLNLDMQKQTDEESDAIAALEQIKHAGASSLTPKDLPRPRPSPIMNGPAPQPPSLSAMATRIPPGALTVLARLIQQQQALPAAMQSPFQGRPASPPKSGISLQSLTAADVMRTCFSETSADRLVGRVKKEQPIMDRLQSIVDTSDCSQQSEATRQLLASFAPAKGRTSSGPLPGAFSSTFPTQASETATDTIYTIGSVIGQNAATLTSALGQQDAAEVLKTAQAAAAAPKASLGAFGSIIRSAMDEQAAGSKAPPSPPTLPLAKPAPSQETMKPNADAAQKPLSTSPKMPAPQNTTHQTNMRQGVGANPGQAAVRDASPQFPTSSPPFVAAPDPRILEWVLGHRSLTDRGKQNAAKSLVANGMPSFETLFSRTGTPAAPPLRNDSQSGNQSSNTTLRRPKAIRASDMQEGMPGRSETVLDSLFSRIQAASVPSVADSALPGLPKLADSAAATQQHPLSSSDVGRVMQWAGTELALRDQKVREAEKARADERRAHDAAMNAVGTEVARLKRGQAELAITHYNLQEALTAKDTELRDKCKLVQQLSTGIAEITQQGIFVAKEAQHFRCECEQLQGQLGDKDSKTLDEIRSVEDALRAGGTGVEAAFTLLSAWKSKLDKPARHPQSASLPSSSH